MVGRQLVALGCVVVGVWLLAVGLVYSDWLAVAVALVSMMFGVYQLRPPG